jgi:hypothetical protein
MYLIGILFHIIVQFDLGVGVKDIFKCDWNNESET